MSSASAQLEQLARREYAYGFSTDLDTDLAPKGLSEDVIRLISLGHEPLSEAARLLW